MKIIYVYIIIFVITDVVTLCEFIKSYHKNLQKNVYRLQTITHSTVTIDTWVCAKLKYDINK